MTRWLLIFLLLAAPLCAREVSVVAMDVSHSRKLRIENAVDEAFAHVTARTGLQDEGRLELTLCGDAGRFGQIAAADGVSMSAENVLGYALPASRRIVLNLAAIDERRLSERGVLRHEVAHLVLESSLQSKRPLWFEEGVAQWVESVALDALIEAAAAQLPPEFASFEDLSLGLRDPRDAGAAYKQARNVVEFIVRRHGEDKLRDLLQRLRPPGVGFSAAFREACGEELSAFEQAALGELARKRQNALILFLGANWWWMLFSVAGLLALILWLKRRRRGQDTLERWEEQEKLYPSDPQWSYADDADSEDDDPAGRRR